MMDLLVVRVPLLSQEGPTCRLLPGATAPYPALDPGTEYLAAARFVSKLLAEAPRFVLKFSAPAEIVFVLQTAAVVGPCGQQ